MKVRFKFLVFGFAVALFLGLYSCFPSSNPPGLVVAIAASLTDAMTEIQGEFQRQYPDITVQFNTAASGTLQRQIEQQAPIDIFASAALGPMESLVKKGLIAPEKVKIFAQNQLLLIQSAESQPQLTTLADLASPAVRNIALGNPKTVPAGQYTMNLLEKHPQLYHQLEQEQKIVFGENVRQVLTYVKNQSVVAGFVYRTDIFQQPDLRIIEAFSTELTGPILYTIAPIKTSRSPTDAELFINFVMGQQGQEILRKYGFLSPRD